MAEVYASDYLKDEAVARKQDQVDSQDAVVNRAVNAAGDLFSSRRDAQKELIYAKEDLLDATTDEEKAAARTKIQRAERDFDRIDAEYQNAVQYRNEQLARLNDLKFELEDIQNADVDPDLAEDVQAQKEETAEEALSEEDEGNPEGGTGVTKQVEDHTPWVTDGGYTAIYNLNKALIGNNPNLIYPGQTFQMPGGGTYKVVSGDNLTLIAQGRGKGLYTRLVEEPAEEEPPAEEEVESTPTVEPPPEPVKKTAESGDKYQPRINPLHQYATYTYSIALYILSREDINELTTNPSQWTPSSGRVKTCLIASGGKNSGQYARNDNFVDDFYFSELKMTTVIGLNNRSKASNAIDISFTVVEPYGMSLLDRIIAASTQVKAPNFKSMPYLLEVDFYGSTDAAVFNKLGSQRKRIPIQIIELKIKAGTKGSEYQIKAIPWNHQALSQSAASVPINLEVKASTVGEFFYNNVADQLAVSKQDAEKMAASSALQRKESTDKEAKKTDASGRLVNDPRRLDKVEQDPSARAPTDEEAVTARGVVNRAFAVSSFCGGINAWYTDLLLKKLRGTKDQIRFNIHDDIAKTKIVVPATKDITRSAVRDDKPADAAKAAAKDANRVFTDAAAFPISAGTSVTQVIDMVMRNSSYITDQIKDPANMTPQDLAEREGKKLNWYKVIPTIELGPYDYALNKFSTTTTYHIMPYTVYDSKHPNGPSSAPKGSIKQYYYSYTGKNTDILDFQIDFDTLYYTAVTAGAAKWQAEAIQQAAQQKDEAARVAALSAPAAADLVNRQLRLVSSQPQSTGAGGTQNGTKPILAADIQKGLYSSSRGDMLNLKLKIVGDPELIKQDDIYTNPAQEDYLDKIKTLEAMTDTGSVPMDTGEVMAHVEFRTIVDMNPLTGLPLENPTYAKNSVFTGLYKILTVDNVFSGGKFEQVIDLIRVPDAINPVTKDSEQGTVANRPKDDREDDGTADGARTPESDDSDDDSFEGNEVDNPNDTEEAGDEAIEQADQDEIVNEEDYVDAEERDLEDIEDNAEEKNIDDADDDEQIQSQQVEVDF